MSMATGTGVQRESRPPRGRGWGAQLYARLRPIPCPAPSLSADPHCSGLTSWITQKGSHPARSQRLRSAPAPPVSPPGDPAPGAPGGRWLKRAGGSQEPPLRAANDRRPPGPTLPARGGGAQGGLDWLRQGWNSGGVRRMRRGPAPRRPAGPPAKPLLHSQPQFPTCTVEGMGACQVGAELKLGIAVNSSELVASRPMSSARPRWTSLRPPLASPSRPLPLTPT